MSVSVDSKMRAAFIGFKAVFVGAMSAGKRALPAYARDVTSDSDTERYPFSILMAAFKRWMGSFEHEKLDARTLDITNEDFKMCVDVNRNAIKDDKVGMFKLSFEQMGESCANLWVELIGKLLDSTGAKWLDGADFFGTSRKIRKSTISNKSTNALTQANFLTARTTMMAYKKASGSGSLLVVPDTIVVGPSLEATARELFEGDTIVENGATVANKTRGMCKIEVCLEITDNRWYLMDTKKPVKPVIVQKNQEPTLVAVDKEDSAPAVERNENEYHAHARGSVFFSCPWLVFGSFPV